MSYQPAYYTAALYSEQVLTLNDLQHCAEAKTPITWHPIALSEWESTLERKPFFVGEVYHNNYQNKLSDYMTVALFREGGIEYGIINVRHDGTDPFTHKPLFTLAAQENVRPEEIIEGEEIEQEDW